jgi:tetratricopeptide (TPR) repeat protein
MKITFTLILTFTMAYTFAQESAIEKAEKLIENKKYESAYHVLNESDPNNEKPEIVIAKTNLFLYYFVSSMMHQMFALKDLEPNEEVLDVRGTEGAFSMFLFSPDSILLGLIEKYPTNYELMKELGFYYHEVHLKYNGRWLIPDSVLVDKFKTYYLKAYENNVFDYWSAYGIGYAYLMSQDYKSSIPFFEKSIELKNDYPSSHYNHAFACLYTDQREKAIKSAKKAMDLYDYPDYKADAARMIAVVYKELDDTVNAIDFYRQAAMIKPGDYYTLKPLLELEVAQHTNTYGERTKEFFLLAPGNPTIYQDLMDIYWNYNMVDELLGFLSHQQANYIDDNKVKGNLYFYTAVIQYDKEDVENANLNFGKAREQFMKVFDPDHPVFEAIDSYTR